MKLFYRFVVRASALTCGMMWCAPLCVSAVSREAVSVAQTIQTTQTPLVTVSDGRRATGRARRAEAYAKVLEGQRYMVATRTGGIDTRAGLEAARAAFQTAAQLDPNFSEPHVGLAEIAFFSSDLPTAEREAQTAIKLDANNYGAHKLLSRIYAIQSNLTGGNFNQQTANKAIAALREVVRLNPNDVEAYTLLGEFYQSVNRSNEAVEAFRRAASAPALVDTRFLAAVLDERSGAADSPLARLAGALLRAGRNDEAVETVRRALAVDPTNIRYLQFFNEALTSGVNNPQPIIEELERLVRLNPDNTNAVLVLARANARTRNLDAAAQLLRSAVARRATNENANLQELYLLRRELGNVLTDAMRYAEARQVYEDILKANNIANAPLDNPRAQQIAAQVLTLALDNERQARRPQEARAIINRMRVLFGADDPNADIQLAFQLREEGKKQEALTAIRAALKKFPRDEQLQMLEAATLAETGQTEAAVTQLRAKLTNTPADYNKYLYIANAYLQAGRAREAVEAARKAVEFAPPESSSAKINALALLSSAQDRTGDFKGSEETLRQILLDNPNNPLALNNLGYFLIERNERLEEALELIQRAVRAEPFNASFLDSLGWAYFKLNRLDEAEKYLTEAARRNATSATIHEHLGDLYQKRGRAEDARTAWRKALSLSSEADETTRLKQKINGNR